MVPPPYLVAAWACGVFVLSLVNALTLSWMMYAWWSDTHWHRTAWKSPTPQVYPSGGRLSFSLIVPARHEEQVLERTLSDLAQVDHPDFEILVVVGDDDPGTAAKAYEARDRWPNTTKVIVDYHEAKNKPKALNTALPHCQNDVVGIIDAEDVVSRDLLRAVEAQFIADSCDVVQSGVQPMNLQSRWYAARNVLEYYFWFRSRLFFHASRGVMPLGGNTVFVLRRHLLQLDGWDANCLTEDCDLGIRLSAAGARISVSYAPTRVTKEEVPASFATFLRQRTRWHQGFIQVLRKGDWRDLPRLSERIFALFTLAMPIIQAWSALVLPLSLVTILIARVAPALVVFSFVPLVITLVSLGVEVVALGEFCRQHGSRARARDFAFLVLSTIPYQLALSWAACRAVAREILGVNNWEKTHHEGLHHLQDSKVDAST